LEKYRAALELDPEHGGFRLNLGLALCRLGRWDEGIAEMREVVRRDPDNAEATKALYIAMEQQPKSPVPAAKAVTKPPQ
jgi:predicted Zn-dependent protease